MENLKIYIFLKSTWQTLNQPLAQRTHKGNYTIFRDDWKNKYNIQNENRDIPINCTKIKRILRELYVNKLGNLDEIDKLPQTRN